MKLYLQNLLILLIFFSYSFQIKCPPNPQKNSNIVLAITNNSDKEVTIGKTESFGENKYQPPRGIPMKTADYKDELDVNMERPEPGKLEIADELPTVVNYYNGDKNLNLIKINCNIYTNQFDCLHNSNCGWCPPKNNCMEGNAQRSFDDCPEGFLFAGNLLKNRNTEVHSTTVRRMGSFIKETILP